MENTIFEQIKNCPTVEDMAAILANHYIYSKEAFANWLKSPAYTENELKTRKEGMK